MTRTETETETGNHRPSLLLVDDHSENLLALEAVLADLDLDLVTCQTGQEALRQVLKRDFALILLDVHMPDMDGFEVASLLRKRQKSAAIPIIFMTASTASELQMFQGYALGAVDYMWKPIVPGVLRSKVLVFVELYQKTAEVRRQSERLREIERGHHAQALLLQSEKMDAIRRLAGGVAHDFDQLLARMSECGEKLQHQLAGQSEAEDLLQGMLEAGTQARALTEQLQLFARSQPGEDQVVSLYFPEEAD